AAGDAATAGLAAAEGAAAGEAPAAAEGEAAGEAAGDAAAAGLGFGAAAGAVVGGGAAGAVVGAGAAAGEQAETIIAAAETTAAALRLSIFRSFPLSGVGYPRLCSGRLLSRRVEGIRARHAAGHGGSWPGGRHRNPRFAAVPARP